MKFNPNVLLIAVATAFVLSCTNTSKTKVSPEEKIINRKIDSLEKQLKKNDSILNAVPKKPTKKEELDTMRSRIL
ncbi:hypothetical protein [Cellulophaga fucicola]|uniref:Uncharacterized protein n=1 Tax=Cellulophaga fucicola TaxID=76595 RepID=A0A1K1PNF6_9FLAO|nr:hypothetical protein [Cellulophaga fucicola]SFW49025.1 hypothetical protein SAMN05660313_02027 [Cellulophaga fucicola]